LQAGGLGFEPPHLHQRNGLYSIELSPRSLDKSSGNGGLFDDHLTTKLKGRSKQLIELWRSRGATFLTEPKDKYVETRSYIRDRDGYIRDPDGHIIEVGQSKPGIF
jgi:hypothetical protein